MGVLRWQVLRRRRYEHTWMSADRDVRSSVVWVRRPCGCECDGNNGGDKSKPESTSPATV